MDVFDRYAPFVQDFIYRNGWRNLRAVQVAAADVIFNSDDNLLLTASTASGKTEAAFFPIISEFWERPPASIGCLYIGPLKALINDQFLRLNELCDQAGIPVWHWHGDVSQSHKDRLMRNPSGILQITPESLESMVMHKHMAIPRLFGDLRYVVIDEVHSLLRGDRGGQTLCLIERLSRLAQVNPRRIGLSATMGDPEKTGEFLSAGTGRKTAIPRFESPKSTWQLSMEHFYVKDEQAAGGRQIASAAHLREKPTDKAPQAADPGLAYIFEHTRGKKCLVFVNSREECESVTNELRHYCELNHEADRFLIHHGNLSASYRETAEMLMKDPEQIYTTVTTSTLELGIDIGKLERAFQIDAPWTVSSFLQRMGRTGRRGQPSQMWFVMREDEPEIRALLPATIPWKLLQGIALIQLYLEEKWVEPPRLDRLPFSLLYHQTMSTLASNGELSPAALASQVLNLTYFHRISQDDYRLLLRHLIQIGHIQTTPQGGLIIGLKGESVVNSFKFYGVFQENEEFTVRYQSQELGTTVQPPPPGEKIAIAGRVWLVCDVDVKKHVVYVDAIKGRVPAYFGQCPGDIHDRILERMRRVLQEETAYPYLMSNAVARLDQARRTAIQSGAENRHLIHLGGKMWCLLPWMGTYSFLALERFLKIRCAPRLGLKKLDSSRPFFIQFSMDGDEDDFYRVVKEEVNKGFKPSDLLYPTEVPIFDKYDEYVPVELLRKGFAYGILNCDSMREKVKQWIEERHGNAQSPTAAAGSGPRHLSSASMSQAAYRR